MSNSKINHLKQSFNCLDIGLDIIEDLMNVIQFLCTNVSTLSCLLGIMFVRFLGLIKEHLQILIKLNMQAQLQLTGTVGEEGMSSWQLLCEGKKWSVISLL